MDALKLVEENGEPGARHPLRITRIRILARYGDDRVSEPGRYLDVVLETTLRHASER